MARYIITDSQFHSLVYLYLDNLIVKMDKYHPWNDEGYRVDMYDKNATQVISYFWYAPGGEYDDDDNTKHNGVGSVLVNPKIIDFIRTMFKVRESKAVDIFGDWLSTKVDNEVDDISLFPERGKPAVY